MPDDVSKWRHQYNRWGVGSSPDGKEIRILGLHTFCGRVIADQLNGTPDPERALAEWTPLSLTREHALELAAWIVAVAMPQDDEFEKILAYVRGEPVA